MAATGEARAREASRPRSRRATSLTAVPRGSPRSSAPEASSSKDAAREAEPLHASRLGAAAARSSSIREPPLRSPEAAGESTGSQAGLRLRLGGSAAFYAER